MKLKTNISLWAFVFFAISLCPMVLSAVDVKFRVEFPDSFYEPNNQWGRQEYAFLDVWEVLWSSPNSSPGAISSVHTVSMDIGVEYTFWIMGNELYADSSQTGLIHHLIRFFEVQGYRLLINEVDAPYYNEVIVENSGWTSFTVKLVPDVRSNDLLDREDDADILNIKFFSNGVDKEGGESYAFMSIPGGVTATSVFRVGEGRGFVGHSRASGGLTYGGWQYGGLMFVEFDKYHIHFFPSVTAGVGLDVFTFSRPENGQMPDYNFVGMVYDRPDGNGTWDIHHEIRSNCTNENQAITGLVHKIYYKSPGGVSILISHMEYSWTNATGWSATTVSVIDPSKKIYKEIQSSNGSVYGSDRATYNFVHDASGIADERKVTYKDFNGEEEIHKLIEITDGEEWITEYDYYENTAAELNGSIKSIISPETGKTAFEYHSFDDDGFGRISKTWRTFMNVDDSTLEEINYVADWNGQNTLVGTKSIYQNSQSSAVLVSKESHDYRFAREASSSGAYVYLEDTKKEFFGIGSGAYVETVSVSIADRDTNSKYLRGKPRYVIHPDGRMDCYAYEEGTVSFSNGRFENFTPGSSSMGLTRHSIWHGVSQDNDPEFSYYSFLMDSFTYSDTPSTIEDKYIYFVYGKSTAERYYHDSRGLVVREETLVLIDNGC